MSLSLTKDMPSVCNNSASPVLPLHTQHWLHLSSAVSAGWTLMWLLFLPRLLLCSASPSFLHKVPDTQCQKLWGWHLIALVSLLLAALPLLLIFRICFWLTVAKIKKNFLLLCLFWLFWAFPCSPCQSCSLAALFTAVLTGTALQFALQSCSICSSLLSGAFPVPEWSTAEPECCVPWPGNSRSTHSGWFVCMCRVQVEACRYTDPFLPALHNGLGYHQQPLSLLFWGSCWSGVYS